MSGNPRTLVGALALCGVAGCASDVVTIPLVRSAGLPLVATPSSSTPLEVITHSTAIADPLPVRSTRVAYADLEHALGFAVSSAVVPWASSRKGPPRGGFQLLVELTQARAEYANGRLFVTLAAQATLRTRADDGYLGQTQVTCRQAGLVAPDQGAPVLYACMTHLGRDLEGWLGRVVPSEPS